ncbi:MAG TPA: peptide ABC transporter substrate-binding protein [Gemmatimonadaceae bacterium]
MKTRALAIAALALGVAACGDESARRSTSDTGGTLVISVGGDPETLFPPLASTTTGQMIGDLVYDRLAEIGDSLNTVGDYGFQPRLAKTWDWAPDSLSIAFHIDAGARWHDGRPVRASDVAFTYRMYADSVNGSPFSTALESIDSVTASDSLTATVWFGEKSPMQFYDAVHTMLILPAHIIGSARGTALRDPSIARNPVGSGRFRFVKWNAAQSIELASDTANYRGRANLDRVILTIAPDFNTALTRLLGGEADLIEQVPAANVPDVAGDSAIRTILISSLDYNFVQLNLNDPANAGRPHPLFTDRELRRALTTALDRRRIVRNAYDSLASVAIGPTVRAYPTTDTALRQIPFSRDAAVRTLDSLGWKDSNGDGVRDRNGRKLEFALSVPGPSKARNTMAVLIQEQLRQAGVKVNIELLDFAAFIDRENKRNFDAVFHGWHVEPSPGGIRQTWGSAGAAPGGTNYGSYRNTVFDAHVDSALSSTTLAGRRKHFTMAYQTIIDDAPAIWFAEPKRVMAVHRRIRTPGVRPDAWWAGIPDWSIPAGERIPRDRAIPPR